MRSDAREKYWQDVLGSAGDLWEEIKLSITTDKDVALSAAIGPDQMRPVAKYWKARIDSPGGVGSFLFL